jgi:hypothetical protein
MLSVNIPLLLDILIGKLTTCVRLKVFIIIASFCLAVLSVRRFICRSPQVRKVHTNIPVSLPRILKMNLNFQMGICICNMQ